MSSAWFGCRQLYLNNNKTKKKKKEAEISYQAMVSHGETLKEY